jgi:chorismate synthase
MSADPVDPDELAGLARNAPLTRPRPGHADLVGMQKYGFDDARPVLERASARETAARVALGAVAKAFLDQAYGISVLSHVVGIGGAEVSASAAVPTPADLPTVDKSPVRVFDAASSDRLVAEIDAATRRATRSAAWSRCWPTGCRPGWAATCTGTVGSTRGWPPR